MTVISLFWYGSAHWQVTPSLSLISFTNSHVLYFFISFIFSLFLHSNAANILMFLILIPWYLFSVHILFRLNSDLDECTFERREDGAYITYTPPGGADPVQKKLGSPSDAEREDITASLAIKAVGSPNSHTVTASIDFNYDLIYLFVRATAASVTDITAYAGSPVILDTIPCPKSGGLYTIVAKNMTEGTAIRIAHNAGTGELQIIAIGMRQ